MSVLVKVASCKSGLVAFDTLESIFLSNSLIKDENKPIIKSRSSSTGNDEGKAMSDTSKAGNPILTKPVKKADEKLISPIRKKIVANYKKQLTGEKFSKDEKALVDTIISYLVDWEMKGFLPYSIDGVSTTSLSDLGIETNPNFPDVAKNSQTKLFDRLNNKIKYSGIAEIIYSDAAYEDDFLTTAEKKQNDKYLSDVGDVLESQIKGIYPDAKNFKFSFNRMMKNAIPYKEDIWVDDGSDVTITFTVQGIEKTADGTVTEDGTIEPQFLMESLEYNND